MSRLRSLWATSSWKKRTGLLAGAAFVLLLLAVGIGYARTDVPAPNRIATEQATRILYADGSEIGRLGKNRRIVPLSQVSKPAQHAVLAAEDRDFYSEPGISVRGIARALFTNVKGGGVSQGGSTITQQYAKNAFLTQERTFTRKVKEVFIAVKMAQTRDKDTILEDYLNTIYFGRGAYGIEAAAETYFRTTAAKLTPAQAAVLASSIRSPAAYDPTRHPERAKERWDYVLDGMVKKSWLTSEQRAALRYPPVIRPGGRTSFPGPLEFVQRQVVDELQAHGFPEERISAGGLTVTTTLSRAAQAAAVRAVEANVPAPAKDAKNYAVGALVAVQPGTGKVVAYYGGRDPGGFDYAAGGKGVQPGSSMKPYVLAAALEKGTALSTQLDGSSPQDICGTTIHNDAGDPPLGQTDLVTGLALSVNTVYYRLACETGAQRVADLAHAAGIPDKQPLADDQSHKPTAQIALGSGGYEVHVLDQAVGYATFAAKGERAKPFFVAKVTDSHGNELYTGKPSTGRAFSEAIAADTTYAMQQVVKSGTGRNAQLDGRPTAGKTGTTGNNANAWFSGFTPQLTATAWVGMSQGGRIALPNYRRGVYGGTVPAKVFKAFMDAALRNQPVLSFPPPANVGAPATPSAVPTTATPTPSASPTPSQAPSPTPLPTTPPPTLPPVLPSSPPPGGPSASPTSTQQGSPQATAAATP